MDARQTSNLTRRFGTGALAIAVVLTLAGCDYFGFTPIKDISATPAQFEGKEVKIKGRAVDPVQLLSLRSFTLKDDTGENTVTTNGALPPAGAEVAVRGTVKSAVIVSGKSIGTRVEETQRIR